MCRPKQYGGLWERLLKKINGWASKFFSAGGKETLIKSVLQAIPSYAMSCFKLPISLCNELKQCCAKFWWNSKSSGGSMHWVRWRKMCRPKQYGGMGFQSLYDFNKALLAKQVWRIICNPSSLMAQVLKARYFKFDDIMTAHLGSNPSYIWRSILWSRDLIQKGLMWRVGNGIQINAYSDSWILKLASGKSSLWRSNESLMVHELISQDRTWNDGLVRTKFPSFEADSIMEIPLRHQVSEDIRYWKWGKKCHYSVKSRYLLEIGCFEPLESQSGYFLERWWKLIWKIHIPQKVKIFLWRASKDLLPTNGNLFKRHIHASGCCFFCGSPEANTSHSLFFCPKVRDVWKATKFWPCLKKGKLMPFISCGLGLQDCFSIAEFEQFAMIAWAIWTELCKIKHAIQIPKKVIAVNWVLSYLELFQNARTAFHAFSVIAPRQMIDKWSPPPLGQLRLDVDAGIKESLGIVSVGAVIRNYLGFICAASASSYYYSGSVVDAELHAIHFGMMLALQCNVHSVWIYSYSLTAVKEVNSKNVGLNLQGVLVSNIVDLLKSNRFNGISHVCRNANKVAHCLAQFALSHPSQLFCVDGLYPSWLMDVASLDLSND